MLTLYSVTFAATPSGFTPEEIRKAFETQQSDKFRNDNLETALPHKLIEAKIVKQDFTTTVENSTTVDCNSFMNTNGWTAAIYNLEAISGTVTCMYAEKNDLYNPQGLFNVFYPKIKEAFALNTDLAKQQNASIIALKYQMTKSLIDTKNEISKSISEAQGKFLSIPALITAGVLADPNIINAAATEATGKLQLKGDYTSQYTSETGLTDNGYIIKGEITNIFKTYAAISSSIMDYLFMILIFVALFTAGRMLIAKLNPHDRSVAPLNFGAIALIGFVVFFPVTEGEYNAPGQDQGNEFKIISSRFQDISRKGFYWFSELGDSIAKKITDNTLETLLNRSGIGSSQQIVAAAAEMARTQKLIDYHSTLKTACENTYDKDYIVGSFGNPNTIYPQSERWAQAIAIYVPTSGGRIYYNKFPEGLVRGDVTEGTFPQLSFSFCHQNDNFLAKYTKQHKDYQTSYNAAIETDPNGDEKIVILKTLVKFQYQLYRDWGYVSILGLPVIQLQTDNIGMLYQKDDVSKKLEEKIGNSDYSFGLVNSFVSAIPFLLVPGAGNIYDATKGTLKDLSDGASNTILMKTLGWFGANIATSVAMNVSAFTIMYTLIKVLLSLLPITCIVIIGLMRFVTIIIKIFAFHFGSLLIFPIVFAQQNGEIMGKFAVKQLLLMIEIPIFVLSVWLAITANSLIHTVGDIFSKEIILGMLANNSASISFSLTELLSLPRSFIDMIKIYLLNGFFQIAISLFSIFIISKIILSLHTALYESLELKSTEVLDHAVASLRQEANLGGKI